MNDENKLADDWLYEHEREFGAFYCSTVKQLRMHGYSGNLSVIARACNLEPEIVRKMFRGQFNKPFVKYVEAVNRALNNGFIIVNEKPLTERKPVLLDINNS